jgi:hypothetical protein
MLRSMLGGVEVCLEGLGEIDSRLRTVGLWLDKGSSVHALAGARIGDPVYRRGLVYYLRGDKVSLLIDRCVVFVRAAALVSAAYTSIVRSRCSGHAALVGDSALQCVCTSHVVCALQSCEVQTTIFAHSKSMQAVSACMYTGSRANRTICPYFPHCALHCSSDMWHTAVEHVRPARACP